MLVTEQVDEKLDWRCSFIIVKAKSINIHNFKSGHSLILLLKPINHNLDHKHLLNISFSQQSYVEVIKLVAINF